MKKLLLKLIAASMLILLLAAPALANPVQEPIALNSKFKIAFAEGMYDPQILMDYALKQGIDLEIITYNQDNYQQVYLEARLPEFSQYDLLILPYHQAKGLVEQGLIAELDLDGSFEKSMLASSFRAKEQWLYDENSRRHYGLPLTFINPIIYYNQDKISNPDWADIFNKSQTASIYLPADPTWLISLAQGYHNIELSNYQHSQMPKVADLLSSRLAGTPAYLGSTMLHIADDSSARMGVILSTDLNELAILKEQADYANWQLSAPTKGLPLQAYYGVIPLHADIKMAEQFLLELTKPQVAADHTLYGGYLPTAKDANQLLPELWAAAYPDGNIENDQFIDIDPLYQFFSEQMLRNAWLEHAASYAKQAKEPDIAAIQFSFYRDNQLNMVYNFDLAAQDIFYYNAAIDGEQFVLNHFDDLFPALIEQFEDDLAYLMPSSWPKYNNSANLDKVWQIDITFEDNTTYQAFGQDYPLLWPDLAAAVLNLSGLNLVGGLDVISF